MSARLHAHLSDAPLSVDAAHAFCTDPEAGAVVVFTGNVRATTDGRSVAGLDYEAYDEHASAQLQALAGEVAARWPALAVWIEHRTGSLAVTEPSVVVGVSTPHRHEAFAAARHAIDTLKETAAIWKSEQWADGGSRWVGADGAPDQ